jgi:hypothetical protein
VNLKGALAVVAFFVAGMALAEAPHSGSTASLRLAIEDLSRSFPDRYRRGGEFLDRLAQATNEDAFAALQREALVANPLVSGQPILFVSRPQYLPDHHNTETMFQTGECNTGSYRGGGALKVLDLAAGGAVRTLVDPGRDGMVRDPDVYFDGHKVIFSMRRDIRDNYHLYEVNADPSAQPGAGGSGLRQLTSAPGVFDIDPIYLPDESVVFSSSRDPKYCFCNKHIMGNLFRMEADGANIHQIGGNTLFEGHPNLMPDGRILYDRWEYVDRNFGDAQGLWTVNPDGTQHAVYYGNNTESPGAKLDGRILPNGLCLCTFTACHDRPWGALALLDRSKGVDGREPVLRTWPRLAADLVGPGEFDRIGGVRPRYEDAYPLNDKYFLAARCTGGNEQTAIVLLDIFGNEIELYAELPGCYDPMPLGQRPPPPVIPVRRVYTNAPGRIYVQDVYVGTHMEGVKRGDVKSLRVVESGEKRSWNAEPWTGQYGYAPGTQWPPVNWGDLGNKRVLGTVPVDADGSAYFECPPHAFVFFQLLDAKGRMIQTMRSGALVQPGELQGCIGCHENRVRQTPVNANPIALQHAAVPLRGWHGRKEFFSYARDVQPVWDRNCIRCHDYGKPAGAKLLLCGDRAMTFSASYKDLFLKHVINCLGTGRAPILQPYAWGSNRSKLVETLDKGHHDVRLTPEEMDTIVTWIDLNGPYYPTYDCAYPENLAGRCPLDNTQVGRLGTLVGLNFKALVNYGSSRGAMVSFDRPEISPCLAALDKASPGYAEALAIIRAGQAQLKAKPEADREGFVPAEQSARRREFLATRQRREAAILDAMATGRKVYDGDAK